MLSSEKVVVSILTILVALLVWFGYSHGAENLPVLLTVFGGLVFAGLGSSGNSEGGMLICVLLIIVGVIFALTGAGFLVAGALLLAAIFTVVGASIALNA